MSAVDLDGPTDLAPLDRSGAASMSMYGKGTVTNPSWTCSVCAKRQMRWQRRWKIGKEICGQLMSKL